MDNVFLLKLTISFLVGSLWITCSTILAEKLGSRIGGVLAGVPSTAVIALFFIGWTHNPVVAAQATTIIPLVLGIDAVVVIIYCYILRFNFYLAIVSSLIIWFLLSITVLVSGIKDYTFSIICFIILTSLSYFLIENILSVESAARGKYKFSYSNLLFRSLLGGFTIAISVFLTKFGGPLLGGAFASFPAVVFATMAITYFAQGEKFSLAVTKITTISGLINVLVYSIAVRYLYPMIGLINGTIFSFFLSLVSAYLVYIFVKRLN